VVQDQSCLPHWQCKQHCESSTALAVETPIFKWCKIYLAYHTVSANSTVRAQRHSLLQARIVKWCKIYLAYHIVSANSTESSTALAVETPIFKWCKINLAYHIVSANSTVRAQQHSLLRLQHLSGARSVLPTTLSVQTALRELNGTRC